MIRWAAAGASAIALVLAIVFVWKSHAANRDPVPSAPVVAASVAAAAPAAGGGDDAVLPPSASAKSKEEKRFDRADKNKDGKIALAELLEPRRKAFAKLDTNHDGVLSFDEWAVKTETKFRDADADHNNYLTRAEFVTTAPKRKAKSARCACQPAPAAAVTETGEE
jgi:hypothetical protein